MLDLTNNQFGDYHILRHLGSGAMAEVFLAEQRSLARRIALKLLKKELAEDEIYVRRFMHEAQAIARIVHPNIVHVYEVGQIDGWHFIAQEYVPGENLLQRISRLGTLPVVEVEEILWLVASALEKTSNEGIVHRDIKPENILISDTREVKIADFGLARVLQPGDEQGPGLTQTGMTVGTPLYMSPEQTQGKRLDFRSDMYSLGITCYHALAGHPPFQGETSLSVALAHVNQQAKPLEEIRSDIPPALARIVHRMIAKDPETRFSSFLELRQELRQHRLLMTTSRPAEPGSRTMAGLDWDSCPLDSTQRHLVSVTQKLGDLMRRETSRRRSFARGTRLPLILVTLLPFLLGGALAYCHLRMRPIFLQEPEPVPIPKQHNVAEQWLYAVRLGSESGWQPKIEDAWNAVGKYFPEYENTWGIKAKEQLARYYYHNDNAYDAQILFQEFADMSDIWPEYRALGLAGLAWCYAKSNDIKNATDMLRQLVFIKAGPADPLTEDLIASTLRQLPPRSEVSSLHETRSSTALPTSLSPETSGGGR